MTLFCHLSRPAAVLLAALTLVLMPVSLGLADEAPSLPNGRIGNPSITEKNVNRNSAASEIAAWAQLVEADGQQGRPLPLTGSWMADKMFGPDRFVEMIEAGNHVILTFSGVSLGVIRRHLQGDDALDKQLESWRPALEYARRRKLPIVFREWNWSSMPPGYQQLVARVEDREIPLEEDLRVIAGGKPGRAADPFGPVEGWRQWGDIWFGNKLLRGVQEIYPDPPMVIFLNNNEGPKVRSEGEIPNDYQRMIDFLGGRRPEMEKERPLRGLQPAVGHGLHRAGRPAPAGHLVRAGSGVAGLADVPGRDARVVRQRLAAGQARLRHT